ncbi:hypothetical protein CRUP_029620 [Coryphaenoides rupestris]|nr:hypothetical protein CRUP_029620 [Coryphaenoides rupestris]
MALGVPANRVVVRVKRMGGGFGGKESRSTILSTVVAVCAQKLQRPVRCMLDRDEDMVVTGGRHPFYAKYKVEEEEGRGERGGGEGKRRGEGERWRRRRKRGEERDERQEEELEERRDGEAGR